MTWFMVGMLIVVGALSIMTPEMSRVTVRLGVDVPREHVNDPVVRTALMRYRILCAVATALVVAAVLARDDPGVQSVWVIVLLVLWAAIYVLCRRPILSAKAEQQWFSDRQVRIGASVSATVDRHSPLWGAHFTALLITLATMAVVIVNYSALPNPYPVHWAVDGQADRWAAKGWGVVLAGPLIACGVVVLLWGLAWVISRHRDTQFPDGDAASAHRLSARTDQALQMVLGITNLACSLVLAVVALLPVLKVTGAPVVTLIPVLSVLVLLPAVWAVVGVARAQHRERDECPATTGPDSPNDDHVWKLGLFYYNTSDPAFFVPKRSGIGYTVNVGTTAGMAFLVASGVILVVAIAAAIFTR